MSGGQKARYEDFLNRYNRLKQQWFSRGTTDRYTDGSGGRFEEGERIESPVNRTLLAQQFEEMGVEIPLSPNDAPVFKQRSDRT